MLTTAANGLALVSLNQGRPALVWSANQGRPAFVYLTGLRSKWHFYTQNRAEICLTATGPPLRLSAFALALASCDRAGLLLAPIHVPGLGYHTSRPQR